jgi:hypothetical protein
MAAFTLRREARRLGTSSTSLRSAWIRAGPASNQESDGELRAGSAVQARWTGDDSSSLSSSIASMSLVGRDAVGERAVVELGGGTAAGWALGVDAAAAAAAAAAIDAGTAFGAEDDNDGVGAVVEDGRTGTRDCSGERPGAFEATAPVGTTPTITSFALASAALEVLVVVSHGAGRDKPSIGSGADACVSLLMDAEAAAGATGARARPLLKLEKTDAAFALLR